MTCSIAGTKRYRALFVSDLHLGTKACQAEAFLDFLRATTPSASISSATLSTSGASSAASIGRNPITTCCRSSCAVCARAPTWCFIPGNHDEAMRDYCGVRFGGIAIERNIIHVGADGRRYLVMHGDEFDVVVRYAKWLALLGDWSYDRRALGEHPFQRSAPLVRHALLVALGLSQAQGQARGELYRRVRDGARRKRRAATGRKA